MSLPAAESHAIHGSTSSVHCAHSARYIFYLSALLFAFSLTACSRDKEPIHQEQILVFGTLVEITLWGVDDDKAQQATAAVIHTLNELHHRWHAWEPGPLTDINARLARGETATLAPDQIAVIRGAQVMSRESGYLFNPAIGKLIGLWGFHSDDRPDTIPPPSQADIQKLVAQHPTLDDLHFNGNELSSANPALQMDFGAYVKSYGVDRAIDELRQHEVSNAIVNDGAYWSQMQAAVDFHDDIMNGVIKSVVFGVVVTWIALFEGYDTIPTAEGISRATTRTVVNSSLAVLGLDFILTALMFNQ